MADILKKFDGKKHKGHRPGHHRLQPQQSPLAATATPVKPSLKPPSVNFALPAAMPRPPPLPMPQPVTGATGKLPAPPPPPSMTPPLLRYEKALFLSLCPAGRVLYALKGDSTLSAIRLFLRFCTMLNI